ncbi:MAG: NUDIX hydrolase [Candidatus Saccharibacteria bacterium]
MKLNVSLPTDHKLHRFCIECNADGVEPSYVNGLKKYYCKDCKQTNDVSIYLGPTTKLWVDDNNEIWHETAGIFVRNTDGKYLFYQRDTFPYSLTIPAGHVDTNDIPEQSANRELLEETGITGKLTKLFETDIPGDSCSGGADYHKWHVYITDFNGDINTVQILEEGHSPIWLDINDVLQNDITFAVRYIIENYKDKFTY